MTSAVTCEGNRLAIEHLCDVLRRTPGVSCTQAGNPNRHSFDRERGSRDGATSNEGFWSLTIDPDWVTALAREAIRMTARVDFEQGATVEARPAMPWLEPGSVLLEKTAPLSRIEAGTRRDQALYAADVLWHILGDPERRAGIETVWRMGGVAALEGPIADAMHANGLGDLLITGRRDR